MGRVFELVCIVLLGLGQMCIMTGYDTQSFVQESVLHSVHEREPGRIDAYAGYYGQAVCYAAYMLSCLFAPYLMTLLGPKWTLFLGSLCYTAYQVGFFFLNSYYYYISCAVMGAGFALYYTGNGGYLTSHSSRKTIQQNSAISWAIGCICMLLGSAILVVIFSMTKEEITMDNGGIHNETEVHQYRRFSSNEILWMYGAFTAVTVMANVIFLVIPTRESENCIEGRESAKNTTFKHHMGEFGILRPLYITDDILRPLFTTDGILRPHFSQMASSGRFYHRWHPQAAFTADIILRPIFITCGILRPLFFRRWHPQAAFLSCLILSIFVDTRMVLLSMHFIHLGLYTAFWVSVYPTTLVFTSSLGSSVYLPAIYSCAVGAGEIIMCSFISKMSDRYRDFGLKPTMAIGFGLTTVALGLILASTPIWSTIRPNAEPALLFQPSVTSCTFIAFVLGLADSTINTTRAVICALGFPDKRPQAFSISKFYQALGGAVLMFASPQLSIIHYCVLLFVTVCLTTVCFFVVAEKTRKMERENVKFSLESTEKMEKLEQ